MTRTASDVILDERDMGADWSPGDVQTIHPAYDPGTFSGAYVSFYHSSSGSMHYVVEITTLVFNSV